MKKYVVTVTHVCTGTEGIVDCSTEMIGLTEYKNVAFEMVRTYLYDLYLVKKYDDEFAIDREEWEDFGTDQSGHIYYARKRYAYCVKRALIDTCIFYIFETEEI